MTKLLGDKLLIGEEPLRGYISMATFLGDNAAAGNVSMVTCLGDNLPAACVSKVMVLLGNGDLRGLVSMVMGENPRGGIPTVIGELTVPRVTVCESRGCVSMVTVLESRGGWVSMCTTLTMVLGEGGVLGVFSGVVGVALGSDLAGVLAVETSVTGVHLPVMHRATRVSGKRHFLIG